MLTDFAIRRASLVDGDYVMALQRANRESVGGLPRPAIDERLGRGTVVLGILNGDPNYVDSWVDIAGYAKLVADRLEGNAR